MKAIGKQLLISEKPSVGKDIARVLGAFTSYNGYLENKDYVVTWAYGHLVRLADPDEYEPILKYWRMEDLPIIPEQFMLKPNKEKHNRDQLQIINNLLKRIDIIEVINGCDSAREGQIIFDRLMVINRCNKPVKRLWLNETTDKAIKTAFNNLNPEAAYDNLTKAAEARSEADWLIGINASRVFSLKSGAVLPIGRVETPTLNLIVKREAEITQFTSKPYWEMLVLLTTEGKIRFPGQWFKLEGENKVTQFFIKSTAEKIQSSLPQGSQGKVVEVQQDMKSELQPQLFSLTELQKVANQLLGLTAAQTLEICQKLYEGNEGNHKLLTYPRTDSKHLTESMAETIPQRLKALKGTELEQFIPSDPWVITDKRWVDDSKVSDHTAIIITETTPEFSKLTKNESSIYMLVAKRVVAMYQKPMTYMQTIVTSDILGENFLTKGKQIIDLGWKRIASTSAKEILLPKLNIGDDITLTSSQIIEKATQPPKRYTEATLLAGMEGVGRHIEDKAIKQALNAANGLGTPATRAAIIEKMVKSNCIERSNQNLLPTTKGITLIGCVTEKIKNPEMTGEWEQKLALIEKGKLQKGSFMQEINDFTKQVVEETKASSNVPQIENNKSNIIGKCPICKKGDIIEGKMAFGCSGYKEGCKFVIWKTISGKKITSANAKKLLEKGQTSVIKGFTSKNSGKSFDAALIFDANHKVIFSFPQNN